MVASTRPYNEMFGHGDVCVLLCDNMKTICGTRRSFCNDDYICQGLYWDYRDGAPTPICHGGSRSCIRTRAVYCHEAEDWFADHAIAASRQPRRGEPRNSAHYMHQALKPRQATTPTTSPVIALSEAQQLQQALANSVDPSKQGQAYTVVTRPGRRGFHNLGNTCYFSAMMQALGHSTVFRSALQEVDLSLLNHKSAAHEFLRIIRDDMYSQTNFEPIHPNEFFRRLERDHPGLFVLGDQEDSARLLFTILDDLAGFAPRLTQLFEFTQTTIRTCAKCYRVLGQEPTMVKQWLLQVPESNGDMMTLYDCLNAFGTISANDGAISHRCNICPAGNGIAHQYFIGNSISRQMGPQILLIQLTRQARHQVPIILDESLDLATVPNSTLTGKYRLVSVINIEVSHYTAQFWDPVRREWVSANDRAVETIGDLDIVSKSTYALLYERI